MVVFCKTKKRFDASAWRFTGYTTFASFFLGGSGGEAFLIKEYSTWIGGGLAKQRI